MISLTEHEVAAVQKFGYSRVLSMLGKNSRFFPFPYWTDLKRNEVAVKEVFEKSLVNRTSRLSVSYSSLTLEGGRLILSIDSQIHSSIKTEVGEIPSNVPVTWLPGISKKANACLTWNSDDQGPEGISAPGSDGSILGGCVLILIGDQPVNESKIVEDGFSLSISNEHWKSFWEAYNYQKAFNVALHGNTDSEDAKRSPA